MLKPKQKGKKIGKKSHSWLNYRFSLRLIFADFVFGVCMIGSLISEMGFLLSFLYMTGWISAYTELSKAKEISQIVGTYSLCIGSFTGLVFGFLADKTRVAPFLYISFILRGLALLCLAVFGDKLDEMSILACFISV
jgi:hypothetical protein